MRRLLRVLVSALLVVSVSPAAAGTLLTFPPPEYTVNPNYDVGPAPWSFEFPEPLDATVNYGGPQLYRVGVIRYIDLYGEADSITASFKGEQSATYERVSSEGGVTRFEAAVPLSAETTADFTVTAKGLTAASVFHWYVPASEEMAGVYTDWGYNFNLTMRSIIELPDDASDFDQNGRVDISDFGTLKDNFGRDDGRWWVDPVPGDTNGTGDVSIDDFGLLKESFGWKAPAAVPEPSTWLLALLAGSAALLRFGRYDALQWAACVPLVIILAVATVVQFALYFLALPFLVALAWCGMVIGHED